MNPENERYLVVSTMKDEAPYLLEWVAWYRLIGFTDFLIYTNDCSDGTDLMLKRLEQLGIVTHEYNEVLRRGPHKSALKHARSHPLYADCDWAFVVDVDEFLNVHYGGGRVTDLRAAYPQADVIPVVWRLFSSNGQVDIPEGLITEQMTDAAPWPDPESDTRVGFIKTLFRADDKVDRLGLHRPFFHENAGEVWSLSPPSDEDPLRLTGDLGDSVAQLNHYAVRAAKSFMVKRDRGRANHTGNVIGFDYWQRWNAGGEQDRSLLRHIEDLRRGYEELLADPILAGLQKAAVEIHRKRAEDVLGDPEARSIFDAIMADVPAGAAAAPSTAKVPPAPAAPPDGAPEEPVRPATELAGPDEARRIIRAILDENDRARAPKRRELRRKMLDEVMPKGARCAEIGVWQGDFSAEILDITQPRELVLIDPWDLLAEKVEQHTHSQHASAARMRAKYDDIMSTIGLLPNCIVRKGFSVEILETYPDGYFDWIYIDGNHMYEFVLEDILTAARKVRSGGLIAGDDLYWKQGDRMPVREAVREAMRRLGDRAKQTRRGAQFLIHLN